MAFIQMRFTVEFYAKKFKNNIPQLKNKQNKRSQNLKSSITQAIECSNES